MNANDLFNGKALTFPIEVSLTQPGEKSGTLKAVIQYRGIDADLERQIFKGGKDETPLPVFEQLALMVASVEMGGETVQNPTADQFKNMHAAHVLQIMGAIRGDAYPENPLMR